MEKKAVSIKRQTIYALIPYVNIWAFYRIQKLRKIILIGIGIGLAFTPIHWVMVSGVDMSNITNPFDLYTNPLFLMYTVVMYASQYAILVYFIRRWSKKWNERFQTENSNS